MTVVLVTFVIK